MAQSKENRYRNITVNSHQSGDDSSLKSGSLSAVTSREDALVAWVMSRVNVWRDYRDQNFEELWNEYYRLWRGKWSAQDKLRGSERSRLIVPALQQAIEATVAELEEATFGQTSWFEVADDRADEDKAGMEEMKNRLMEDFEWANIPASVAEIYLNGALYGTGIGKIIVEPVVERNIQQTSTTIGYVEVPITDVVENIRAQVRLEAVNPRNFVIDTSARNISEALGMAHEVIVPAHTVIEKQKEGLYKDVALGSWSDTRYLTELGEYDDSRNAQDRILITEYHGLVPKNLMPSDENEENVEDSGLVEAIITIANMDTVIKEVQNPMMMKDRAFVAYQHDTVPDRFWGRGIAEKGYNPQKALDAELRARIDGLALTVHPMMAYDVTQMPRGMDLSVRPGKSIGTNGDPNNVLRPLNFGTIDPNIFRDSADLERMVQMGTGAMDSATPTSMNPRNSTATGMSMILSGAIKRSKRTLQNINRNLLSPLIEKSLWRYMQFDEDRYPVADYKFNVVSTLGLIAREFEHAQLTQLLQTVPPASPAYWMVLKAVFELAAVKEKEQLVSVIDQMLQQAVNPPPPQPDFDQQIKIAELEQDKKEHEDKMKLENKRINANVLMDQIKGGPGEGGKRLSLVNPKKEKNVSVQRGPDGRIVGAKVTES